jgi:hypothetical protein
MKTIADRPQPGLRAARQLDQREQDQEEGRIFDEVGMGAHPGGDALVAAVADRDLVRAAAG